MCNDDKMKVKNINQGRIKDVIVTAMFLVTCIVIVSILNKCDNYRARNDALKECLIKADKIEKCDYLK